ncbi:NEL-type E3 ubiquitin ligase domain-containing protein [Pseudomonas sp. WJP1]|uniref:NEL-type E3 ubiquitin ligase domain-containing protein n=1 Tax=Pseudomonas sp. WJP1 TaxID=2986947 RepID=UPI00234A5CF4|nr:NEL-type E3 ubiquitin ligase domain-containing protein [Pseudomonas sp. WJP1]WCM49068.1 NEL-type E3 ubiquitin ligase domain-containing protein [Pseudomonas sp. WJP1]
MPELSPPMDHGFHVPFIKKRLPDWTRHLAPTHIDNLTRARDPAEAFARNHPQFYAGASPALRLALYDSQLRSNSSTQVLAKTLKDFKGITEFAKPLLAEAMNKTFGQSPNSTKTMLFHLRAPNQVDEQTLLQAALRNFELDEPFDEVALRETSALAPVGALQNELYDRREHYPFWSTRYKIRDKLSIKPGEFATLCRQLDLGQQYQAHLSTVFDAPSTRATVREQMIKANKDLMRLQVHIARMKSDLSESAYETLLAVVNGSPEPKIDGRAVAYSHLTALGSALSDVLIMGPVSRKPTSTLEDVAELFLPVHVWRAAVDAQARIIVYIPGDPKHPVKEFASLAEFAKDFAVRLRSRNFQRFIAGLLPQDESPRFFRRLKAQLKTQRWNPNPVWPGPPYNPEAYQGGMYEEVWNDDVNLALSETFIDAEVFGARYEAHLARIKSNARLLAVPTAAVDHQAWIERLEHLAEWGLNILNVGAFFVPGLGEVMLLVTAVQLGREVYQGVEAWKEGDAEEAWGHLTSVMQNVAFMAVLGAVASKAPPITASRFVDGMRKVTTPFGEPRLWNPDLASYKSRVALDGVTPNALGQYEVGDKTYIKFDGNAFEKTYDPALKQWRIKHPTDPEAYQPILQHNQLGAWRHLDERPLEWDRLTLLRRIGSRMEAFSDAQLQQISQVSGVSDDALRQMHIDHQIPPPRLAQTIATFSADQQVDEFISGLRQGSRLNVAAEFAVPLTLELPNWPVEGVLEVFEGTEHWGASQRYGVTSGQHSARPTIKLTRAEVRAGMLPDIVLAALDEQQKIQLLGAHSAGPGVDRVQILRDRLADRALTRRQSLFKRLHTPEPPTNPDIQRLQRSFPTLSTEAAQDVLNGSRASDLSRLRSSGKMSLRQAKAIRRHLQQAALNRTLCGLRLDSMASAASDRLALHSLQHMPGWTAQMRVEVRAGFIQGPLLDSVGSATARPGYYLIKNQDTYRAFDAQGVALNSIPAHGRNLFESLVEVLPQAARDNLQGHQAQALREDLASSASAHREEMAQVLNHRPIDGPGPSLRLPSGQLGYLASGRGFGDLPDAGLVTRVRVLYPNISDEQATQFISSRLSAGDSHQQVFNLLNNRQREFEGLTRQLTAWIGTGAGQAARRSQVERILRCWRNGLYRGQDPAFELDVRGADALPEWDADFSHVKTLRLNSGQLTDDAGPALLGRFSQLKKLDILVQGQDTAALAGKVPQWTTVTELNLAGLGQAYAPQFLRAIEGMTQLEVLSLWGDADSMDFSKLTSLRSLNLLGPARWPSGVLDLPMLQVLDLQTVAIPDLPAELYTGHEALWRGLRLNWGALEPQAFRKAYNYVRDNPAHLADEAQMVAHYCRTRLGLLMPQDYSFATDALARFNTEGVTGMALLERVDALHQQRNALNLALDTWQNTPVRVEGEQVQAHHREVIADRVRECARNSLRAQYAPDEPVAGPSWAPARSGIDVLDMTGLGAIGDLPALGDTVFAHIRRLNLAGSRLTAAQVNDFLRAFPQLRTLELSANRLTELPQAFDSLSELTALDLSFNELTITATAQARINRLTSLQTLNLAYNRVGALDVSSLTNLQSLYLGHTRLTRWPNGALSLPRLRRLALNHSAITDIPVEALTGHDRLLGVTLLQGCRLSPHALAAVRAFAERTPSQTPMGITRAHLAAGRTGGDPEFFPVEVSEQPNLLLPQNLAPVDGSLPPTSAGRLQRLDPQLGEAQAVERIDAWLAGGLGATEIEARLALWEQQQTQLIGRLNEWIDAPASRLRRAWVNAVDRRRAADQLLESWQLTLRDIPGVEGTLDFNGLILGDLPTMPFSFNHVVELDLSDVGLSSNSEGFLRSFPRVRSLTLSQNGLGSLPEAVTQCQELTRLNASFTDIRANVPLQRQLRSLPRLQWLDLGENHLSEFDMTGLDRLQGLDLRGNNLRDWPVGVLEAPALTTLELTSNQISSIPQEAFQPEHADLMSGTNLFDNLLEPDEFVRLQDYLRQTGRGLGFTHLDIDHLLAGFESAESPEWSEAVAHPDQESNEAQKERWFRGVAADSEKHAMWSAMMEQDTTHDFSYILSQLRHTQDFHTDRLGLTQRVWRVIESAYADESLSQRLMGLAKALRHQMTCGDGRILLFNELEVEVFEYEALKSIAPEHKGRELLKLSRRLFRLSQVEEIASARIAARPTTDPAEIRLAYRIGLAQRLDLPDQPQGMLYANMAGVAAADLDQAYTRIIAQEQTTVFNDQLIARKYWRDYLEEKYPAEFTRVQQQFQEKCADLEDQYAEFNQAYFQALKTLEADNRVDRKNLLSELTSRELAEQATMT